MRNIVLLTGITGYLGSYIASELVNRGDVVIGLKRSASDLTRIKRIINKLDTLSADPTPGSDSKIFSEKRTIFDTKNFYLFFHFFFLKQ